MRTPRCSAKRWSVFIGGFVLLGFVSASIANDSAANYTDVNQWNSNNHRGTGDAGNWTIEGSAGSGGGTHGRYLGDSTLGAGDINTDGKSFALFAWPTGSSSYAAAVKRYAKPALTTGDTITFKLTANFRSGDKGFSLRNSSGTGQWNFNVGRNDGANDGYYVRNGLSGSASYDNGQQLGAYHANTVFTFTFTQHENTLVWTIQRTGGITASYSGTANIASGTIADVRFYISNTASTDPVNNLFFNDFTYSTAPNNAPLTLSERRLPGYEPSYILRFNHPTASSVSFISDNDGWGTSYPLTKVDGVWQVDIRNANMTPGWHAFKFRPDNAYESGDNRWLYIRGDGKIVKPPAIFLTWYRDPTTTMAVQWHNYKPEHNKLRYRAVGTDTWHEFTAQATDLFPTTQRLIHKAELTGLTPNTMYEFQLDGEIYEGQTNRFKTLPATLTEPLTFVNSGDADVSSSATQSAALAGALDPAFIIMGGDLAYNDDYQPNFWKWYRYLDAAARVTAPDGRLIPVVIALGNHEIKGGYHNSSGNPVYEPGEAWKHRVGAQFMPIFGIPGEESYRTLDIGDYLSFIITDTDHLAPMFGPQTEWLARVLNERRHVPHLIPVGHLAAYPSVRSLNDSRHTYIRQNWSPLYDQAGVQLVLDHHDHAFKRTPPILNNNINPRGITYIGDGTWGVTLRSVKNPATEWYLDKAESRRHVFAITLRPDGRTIRAIDSNGIVFDEFSQTIDGIPASPGPLTLNSINPNTANLSWQPVVNAHEYIITRNGQEISTTIETSFADSGLNPETSVSYQVFARNRSGTSAGSNIIHTATPAPPPPPAVPQQLAAKGIGPHSIRVSWAPTEHAYQYTVYRNGNEIGTASGTSFSDSGLNPTTSYSYTVAASNMTGASDASSPVIGKTTGNIVPFSLNGQPESSGYLVSAPGMTFYAALRGTQLYVATWTPANGNSDHFIFVTDRLLPSAAAAAPWAKAGLVAAPAEAPYLAAESTHSYISWFNSPPSSSSFRSPDGGNQIEGTIDLVEAFGEVPETIYIAAAAYATTDGGALASQSPAGNGNGNIEPAEFLAIPTAALRDSLGTGTFDRLDPRRDFRAEALPANDNGAFSLRWPAVPGRSYDIWRKLNLANGEWQRVNPAPITAPSGSNVLSFEDSAAHDLNNAYYRIEVLDPQ